MRQTQWCFEFAQVEHLARWLSDCNARWWYVKPAMHSACDSTLLQFDERVFEIFVHAPWKSELQFPDRDVLIRERALPVSNMSKMDSAATTSIQPSHNVKAWTTTVVGMSMSQSAKVATIT